LRELHLCIFNNPILIPNFFSLFALQNISIYMPKEYLGEFEEVILTLVAALQDDAYGAAIADEIESRLKRDVNLSAVHVTLYRLEDKGYIKSSLGGGTNERGGRRKRIYTITSAGMAMLRALKEVRVDLWKMVPQLKLANGK
jgi:PadR family transcriptional regulator PadR